MLYFSVHSSTNRYVRASSGWPGAGPAGRRPTPVEELRSYLLGWKAYFRLADTPGVFRDLDQWIARTLRMVQLEQWKRGRTSYRELRTRDVPELLARVAAKHTRSWWRMSRHGALQTALPGELFEQMGLPRLQPH